MGRIKILMGLISDIIPLTTHATLEAQTLHLKVLDILESSRFPPGFAEDANELLLIEP